MVNNEIFANRIKKLLDFYNLSATQFADKIGVQRSSISHLLSGRNKPSLDFVLKVMQQFNEVDLYWLLNGKGIFPKHSHDNVPKVAESALKSVKTKTSADVVKIEKHSSANEKKIEHIIIFYKDGSFKKYEAV